LRAEANTAEAAATEAAKARDAARSRMLALLGEQRRDTMPELGASANDFAKWEPAAKAAREVADTARAASEAARQRVVLAVSPVLERADRSLPAVRVRP
jgi:hypothetical protein